MESINLDRAVKTENIGHSSKGNQFKWRQGDCWYKADYMGYEGLAEVVVSRLLYEGQTPEHVRYDPIQIEYDGRVVNGCVSRNFLREAEELVTIERLIRQFTGRNLVQELAKMPEVEDRIRYLVENVVELTGLKDFGAYLTALLEIDAMFLNEDRHTNNIAVIYQRDKDAFRLCPCFDHGLSLFSDTTMDFKTDLTIWDCYDRIKAKPFSRDFDEQLEAAEKLYGKQIQFWYDEKEIRGSLKGMEEAYDPVILRRVENVLYQQKRKYSYLFVRMKDRVI